MRHHFGLINLSLKGPFFGKERHLPRRGLTIKESCNTPAPGPLLHSIELTQIQHMALNRLARVKAVVFHHAPVAMFFAILFASVGTQEHDG